MKAALEGNCIPRLGNTAHFLPSGPGGQRLVRVAEAWFIRIFLDEGLTDYDIFNPQVFLGNTLNLSLEDQETSL